MLSLILPTYNERGNIARVVDAIAAVLQGESYEVIVVDDSSEDGTGVVVQELMLSRPYLRLIERDGARGLGRAVQAGFAQAKGDVLGVMDADGQHPPEALRAMMGEIAHGAELVIGSRFLPQSHIHHEWSNRRHLDSRFGFWLARPLVGARITDPLSGLFMLRRSLWQQHALSPDGYKILLELIVKAQPNRISEVPITFGVRAYGESKLDARERVKYLVLLARLYMWKVVHLRT